MYHINQNVLYHSLIFIWSCNLLCWWHNNFNIVNSNGTASVTRKIPRCSFCMFQQSTRACPSCSSLRGKMAFFCDTCFEHHGCRYEKKQSSIWLVENCQECKNLASRWHCKICNQNLCTVCFDVLHSRGNRIHHSASLLGYHSGTTNMIHNVWNKSNLKINYDREKFSHKIGRHG